MPDAATRDAVTLVLNRWLADATSGIGRFVVSNVVNGEHFLPPRLMRDLVEHLLTVKNEPVNEVAETYESKCYTMTLKGGLIRTPNDLPSPTVVGRAINREKLIVELYNAYGQSAKHAPYFKYFSSPAHARLFVSDLVSGKMEEDAKNLLMSSFGTWVTWHEVANSSPFSWLTQNIADEVRAGMGLDGQSLGDILLLEYRVENLKELYRPTIADAGLYEYFQPPPSTYPWYGRTRPWHEDMAKGRRKPVLAQPVSHPEALHEPIPFSALLLPVKSLP